MYDLAAWAARPYTLLLVLAFAVLAYTYWRHQNARRCMAVLAGVLLALAITSLPAVAFFALGSLEWAYPATALVPSEGDVIVVLTGGMRPPDRAGGEAELQETSVCRCQRAAALYHSGEPCVVLVSGGKVHAETPGPPCCDVMKDFLIGLGVQPTHVRTEKRSRTTYESARHSAEILDSRPAGKVFLVTEATHMRRSVACFRKAGVNVIAVPCRNRATEFHWRISTFLPSVSALANVEAAAHEWVGLAWYWLHGRI